MGRLDHDLNAVSRRADEGLRSEAEARRELEHKLRGDLERVMADGLLLSLIGLTWILLGTLLTTLSSEISSFLLTVTRSNGW